MPKRSAAVLAFLFLLTAAAQADEPYAAIARLLDGDSYSLEIDDGAPATTLARFSSIDRTTGTFRASLDRPGLPRATVNGRFTLVPAFSYGSFHLPEHYQVTFRLVHYAFWGVFLRTNYTADLYVVPEDPELIGRGSYATEGLLYGGSRAPVAFTAERVVSP